MDIWKHRMLSLSAAAALTLSLAACGQSTSSSPAQSASSAQTSGADEEQTLVLSQDQVTLNGQEVAEGDSGAVTLSHDIVYYQEGQGSEYGEGTAADEHSAEEADAHLVVTIREAGTYRVSGELTQGQLAVDLGEEAEDDPSAVVTVILDGADVICTVAPAFMVYHVYECGSSDEETASPTVDTSAAGINVIIADGSENTFTGSYVARIYEEGTTDKLHKYDGAFYSKMSMNISGENEGTGVLNIDGENEGLDTELHLTINGGNINIRAQNDGINTNEDNVSVTTINGGTLQINAGLGAEGDGIDSNGYLVINGGNVYATACEQGADAGLDATLDIQLNGGFVVGLGNMLDTLSTDSQQEYMVFTFASTLPAESKVVLSDTEGASVLSFTTAKAGQILLFSAPNLARNVDYTLTVDGVTQQYTGNQAGGFGGGAPGGMGGRGGAAMELPDSLESWLDSAQDVPDEIRTWLEGLLEQQNSMPAPPEGEAPGRDGQEPPAGEPDQAGGGMQEPSTLFTITDTVNTFSGVTDAV